MSGPTRRHYIWEKFSGAAETRLLAMNYNVAMEKKIFWAFFGVLGLAADLFLPMWWAIGATVPILIFSWWVAYRSNWFLGP